MRRLIVTIIGVGVLGGGLWGCGVKPPVLRAPETGEKSSFPRTYPDPAQFPSLPSPLPPPTDQGDTP